jgi:hypothetical protein
MKKYILDVLAKLVIVGFVVFAVLVFNFFKTDYLKMSGHFPASQDTLVTAVNFYPPQFFGFC